MSRRTPYRAGGPPPHPQPQLDSPRRRRHPFARLQRTSGLLTWLVVSAAIALLMNGLPSVATLHAGLVAIGALLVGATGTPALVLTASAYIAGCEILWRMSGASVPWLLGEYSTIVLFGLALLRNHRNPPLLSLLYLLPMLVSVPLTFDAISSLEEARQAIAFNLAGPVALFLAFWYLTAVSSRSLEPQVAARVFLGPAFGVAILALTSLVSAETVDFTDASNFAASGGYGPNQVASVLSLGLLLVLQQRFLAKWRGVRVLVFSGLALFLAFQAALTFSRSGLAMTVGAFAVTLALALNRPRQRLTALTSGIAMALLFAFILVPSLERVTQGSFSKRYTNPSLTGREAIAKTDLQIWKEHPILGVGPGVATQMRVEFLGQRIAGHTEFTRMLAEHGLLGLISLLALGAILVRFARFSGGTPYEPVAAGLASWMVLYFAVNAFRLVLPVFALGLAIVLSSTRPLERVSIARSRPRLSR